jgi:hypothetical protein
LPVGGSQVVQTEVLNRAFIDDILD